MNTIDVSLLQKSADSYQFIPFILSKELIEAKQIFCISNIEDVNRTFTLKDTGEVKNVMQWKLTIHFSTIDENELVVDVTRYLYLGHTDTRDNGYKDFPGIKVLQADLVASIDGRLHSAQLVANIKAKQFPIHFLALVSDNGEKMCDCD